jgi:pyruvate,orthophosphate dikinase
MEVHPMLETRILMAARLKGRLTMDAAAASAAVTVDEATAEVDRLRGLGLVKGDGTVRATPEGKAHVAELVAAERQKTDQDALKKAYDDFDEHNTRLKAIISDWQLRDGKPNDHTDATYDADVLARLAALHDGFRPLVERIASIAPRLAPYVRRFDHALEQVQAGDHTYIARPIADSYHTVWFEFHEELIGLLGLRREEEAAAGRAV